MLENITVIMHTNGNYPRLIEEAIYGVLQQNYKNYILHIVNTHREPCRLDRDYEQIKHIHIPGMTMREQFIISMQSVETPYFCVVDSDDYILPDHIKIIAAGMDRAKREGRGRKGKLAIGTPFVIKSIFFKPRCLLRGGWVRFLYERLDKGIVPGLFANHKRDCGLDRCVDENFPWKRYYLCDRTEATYIYRRKVAYHISHRVKTGKRLYQPNGKFDLLKPQINYVHREMPGIVKGLPKKGLRTEQAGGLRWKT